MNAGRTILVGSHDQDVLVEVDGVPELIAADAIRREELLLFSPRAAPGVPEEVHPTDISDRSVGEGRADQERRRRRSRRRLRTDLREKYSTG